MRAGSFKANRQRDLQLIPHSTSSRCVLYKEIDLHDTPNLGVLVELLIRTGYRPCASIGRKISR